PEYQRAFRWDNYKQTRFIESILLGIPVPPIFVAETKTATWELVDGLQRLSTLFGCLIDEGQTPLKKNHKLWTQQGFNLIYNLETNQIVKARKSLQIFEIELHKFIDHNSYAEFIDKVQEVNFSQDQKQLFRNRYVHFQKQITTFDLPIVELTGASIEEAVEIFGKLNSTGAKVTSEWKLNALSFNIKEGFRLGNEIDNLLKDIKVYNFQNLDRKVIFKAIINSFGVVYFDKSSENDNKKIDKLSNEPNFIENTRKTIAAIKKSIKFLHNEILVIDSKLLPYSNQLIFITDFFNQVDNPSEEQLRNLKEWFWITTYSNYFTIYNFSKQRKAYDKFQGFIKNNSNPIYIDDSIKKFRTEKFPKKISMGSVRGKALALFMLNYSHNFKPLIIVNNIKYSTKEVYNLDENTSENTIIFFEKFESVELFLNKNYFLENFTLYNHKEVLKQRKKKIIGEEMRFVKSLGIDYFEDVIISEVVVS
ncbi:MAG: DUF262 domain-containing protein, partial [Chitinophagales bacterium]